LSHIMVREQQRPSPQNFSGRTLVRVHLIPYTPNQRFQVIRNNNNLAANIQNTINRAFPSRVVNLGDRAPSAGGCYSSKQKRNMHVMHLPRYQKFNETTLKKFSEDICSICHGEFALGEYYRTLPICNHSFHKRCVDRWLRRDSEAMRCPLCRTSHTPESWRNFTERETNPIDNALGRPQSQWSQTENEMNNVPLVQITPLPPNV
jgi:hypothetical protein